MTLLASGYGLRDLVAATARHLTSSDRSHRVQRVLKDWLFIDRNQLPVRFLTELWPEVAECTVPLRMEVSHEFELPYGERAALAAIATHLRPSTIFEFGTFTGSTTRLLADAAPRATLHTIDLPDEEIVWGDWIKDAIGRVFRDRPEYDGRIVLHRCNSRRFDFTPFRGACDLVFVDASHEYKDVVADSERALEIVAPTGIVVWDDYQAGIPGVVRALNEVARRAQLIRVARSRLVIHRPQPFPHIPPQNPEPWARL